MPVRDGREDLLKVLREERRPLRLAARAEVSRPAREREQVLPPAVRAADPREPSQEPPAPEAGLDRLLHHAAQGAVPRLEPLLVRAHVRLEVPLEEAVESRPLGMARAVGSRPLADVRGEGAPGDADGGTDATAPSGARRRP